MRGALFLFSSFLFEALLGLRLAFFLHIPALAHTA